MEKPVWLKDGRSLAVVTARPGVEGTALFEVQWPGGQTSRWGHESVRLGDLDATPDSRKIVAVQSTIQKNIWIVPLKGAVREPWKVDVPAKFDNLAWTPFGTLISRATIGGEPDLWSINPKTLETHAITGDRFIERDPVVSPDGKYLVYVSDREGPSSLWRSALDGSHLIRLTSGSSADKQPTIARDNLSVIYVSAAKGMETLWEVSINGGQPVQLTHRPSRNPVISPDGKKILCEYSVSSSQGWSTVALNKDTGQLEDTYPEIPENAKAVWSADGTEIFYVKTKNGVSEIWAQRANSTHGDKPRLLAHFIEDAIFALAPSPDGSSLACIRGDQSANAVLIETARWPENIF
jgi:Tol biopolymer transport system component